MKYAIAIFATGALITGLKAAYHWYQSSEVQIDPGWTAASPEPVDRDLRQMAQHGAIIEAAGVGYVEQNRRSMDSCLGGFRRSFGDHRCACRLILYKKVILIVGSVAYSGRSAVWDASVGKIANTLKSQ
jgi:hypothetical protein